ncbi:MAG: MBL fold metallo-hydrolase, partial [Methanobacteriota archaeon]
MRSEPLGEFWHRGTELDGVRFTLYNSGHIPGSTQLLIENGARILYTGDLCLKGGLITPPADTPACDILIIEATFGTPRYVFPDKRETIKEMRDWAEDCNAKGATPVFLGYALGKAQEITKALSGDLTVFVEESAYHFNRRTENLGIHLGRYELWDGHLPPEDCVLVAPPHKARLFRDELFTTAYVSGWASGNGAPRFGASAGFPLSDHSDFNGLIEFVERVSPQATYTVHGFAREFS